MAGGGASTCRGVGGLIQPCTIHWIEIELTTDGPPVAALTNLRAADMGRVELAGYPFSKAPFELTGPYEEKGTLDRQGKTRLEFVPTGSYTVRFPDALGKKSASRFTH